MTTHIDRLDAIYDQLWDMANDVDRTITLNRAHPRQVKKADVQRAIERLIGARLVLIGDERADEAVPAWHASSAALDRARRDGWTWETH